jgi:hypothetical protein
MKNDTDNPRTPDLKPLNTNTPDFVTASVPDTLAALNVNSDTGLSHSEVDIRRKVHG